MRGTEGAEGSTWDICPGAPRVPSYATDEQQCLLRGMPTPIGRDCSLGMRSLTAHFKVRHLTSKSPLYYL